LSRNCHPSCRQNYHSAVRHSWALLHIDSLNDNQDPTPKTMLPGLSSFLLRDLPLQVGNRPSELLHPARVRISAASFARSSALSFPVMPLWSGHHRISMVMSCPALRNAVMFTALNGTITATPKCGLHRTPSMLRTAAPGSSVGLRTRSKVALPWAL
jgi:hypothetical protein